MLLWCASFVGCCDKRGFKGPFKGMQSRVWIICSNLYKIFLIRDSSRKLIVLIATRNHPPAQTTWLIIYTE
jgi:hypothetical protein